MFAPASVNFGITTFSKEFFGTANFKRIYLKHQMLVKTIEFFQHTTCSCQFFKNSVSFYLKRGVVSGHLFFYRTGIFWKISLSCLFFHTGSSFSGAVAVIHFFRDYIEHIIFDRSYLLRTTTFGRPFIRILFFQR